MSEETKENKEEKILVVCRTKKEAYMQGDYREHNEDAKWPKVIHGQCTFCNVNVMGEYETPERYYQMLKADKICLICFTDIMRGDKAPSFMRPNQAEMATIRKKHLDFGEKELRELYGKFSKNFKIDNEDKQA